MGSHLLPPQKLRMEEIDYLRNSRTDKKSCERREKISQKMPKISKNSDSPKWGSILKSHDTRWHFFFDGLINRAVQELNSSDVKENRPKIGERTARVATLRPITAALKRRRVDLTDRSREQVLRLVLPRPSSAFWYVCVPSDAHPVVFSPLHSYCDTLSESYIVPMYFVLH